MIEIKLYINQNAKNEVNKYRNKFGEEFKIKEKLWDEHSNSVKCYILYENKIPKSIALLLKASNDIMNIHSNPYLLCFIFTFEQYRRKKFAYKLLLHIKKNNNQITAFCNNTISVNLFIKADLIYTKKIENMIIFRYP